MLRSSMPLLAAMAGAARCASAVGPPNATELQQGGLCLATRGPLPAERTGLILAKCGGVANLDKWREGVDPLGNPQIALALDPGYCINDDSVLCTAGNEIFLHECQLHNKQVHTANHFSLTVRARPGRLSDRSVP